MSLSAVAILTAAADNLQEKAALRDLPDGERSMARTVAAFNAVTGHNLTEVEGWHFMELLKMCRSNAGSYHADDHQDRVSYAALAGECASRSQSQKAGQGSS